MLGIKEGSFIEKEPPFGGASELIKSMRSRVPSEHSILEGNQAESDGLSLNSKDEFTRRFLQTFTGASSLGCVVDEHL